MSMSDYEKAAKLIAEHLELGHFVGSRPESLVRAAERKLGLRFPPTYRRFLVEFGAGSFGSEEIYGLVDEELESALVPNGIGLTLRDRKEFELPHDLVAVYDLGDGETFYLDLGATENGEAPIIVYYPGYTSEEQPGEIVAQDFGQFLHDLVQSQIKKRHS